MMSCVTRKISKINKGNGGAWLLAQKAWSIFMIGGSLARVPDIWEGRGKTCLYVGANWMRQHYLKRLYKAGYTITVLEGYEDNLLYLQRKYPAGKYPRLQWRHGLVQHAPLGSYDLVFFWHGPEHLPRPHLRPVLQRLEAAGALVVLGCPYGEWRQDKVYDNALEIHRTHLLPSTLQHLGYTCHTVGQPHGVYRQMAASHITAYKKTSI